MLSVAGARRPSTSSNADKYTHFSTRPLVGNGFFEYLRCWIVSAGAFVDEHMLADLNRLKGQSRG